MGCGGSKASTRVHVPKQPETRELKQAKVKDDKPESSKQQGALSQGHISVVQNTWQYVKSDLQEVGILFYIRLFQQEPQLLELFSFKDISTVDNLRSDDRARRQALVTMQHVDLAVSSLSDLGSVVPTLKELGGRHAMMYHVTDEHYGPVGAALLYTLESGLGEKFTSEAKEAWTTVYGIVSGTMKAGAKEILDAK